MYRTSKVSEKEQTGHTREPPPRPPPPLTRHPIYHLYSFVCNKRNTFFVSNHRHLINIYKHI